MRWVLECTSGPEDEPVTLAEMRLHLQEFTGVTDNDSEYTAMIQEGREWVEHETGRALIDQTWRLTLMPDSRMSSVDPVSGLTGTVTWQQQSEIVLRPSPVLSVVSVNAVDSAGTETLVDSATYEVREESGKWPRLVALGSMWNLASSDLVIVLRAGFIDHTTSPGTGQIPESFKRAIKLYASAMYQPEKDMTDKYMEAARGVLRHFSANLSHA